MPSSDPARPLRDLARLGIQGPAVDRLIVEFGSDIERPHRAMSRRAA